MTLPVFADRVQEAFITTGTGTISLGGAVTGYQAFASAVANTGTCYYTASDGTNWEVGLGTYATSGNTLARTTIIASSNSNSAVSWAAGTKNIWLDMPASFLAPPVQSTFKNLTGSWSSNTGANWTADQVLLQTTIGAPFLASSVNVTLATGNTVGTANGLDTGSLAANTWYYVYAIYNGTTVASLMSLSATAPTMPTGYTYFGMVGVVRLDGSKNIVGFWQRGRRWQYSVGANLSVLPIAASGTATAWTAIALGSYVPPNACAVKGSVYFGNSSSNTVNVVPNNSYSTTISVSNLPVIGVNYGGTAAAVLSYAMFEVVLESTSIYWQASGTSALAVIGFEINLS